MAKQAKNADVKVGKGKRHAAALKAVDSTKRYELEVKRLLS